MVPSRQNLFRILAGIGVFLVGVELMLRWIPASPAPPEPFLISDPVHGYRLRPGWSNPSGTIRINSQGFRGEDTKTSGNSILIVGIGGGYTFGQTVTGNDKTWPNRLDILYRKILPERSIKVINAGVPEQSLLYCLINLEKRLSEIKPDFVIFLADPDHIKFPTRSKPISKWWRQSRLTTGIVSSFCPPSALYQRLDQWPAEATEILRQHLITLIGLCRVRNIQFVLSTLPNTRQVTSLAADNDPALKKFFPHLTLPAALTAIRSYNKVIRKVALRYGIYLVDNAKREDDRTSPIQQFFLDDRNALDIAKSFLNTTRKIGLHKRKKDTAYRRGSIL